MVLNTGNRPRRRPLRNSIKKASPALQVVRNHPLAPSSNLFQRVLPNHPRDSVFQNVVYKLVAAQHPAIDQLSFFTRPLRPHRESFVTSPTPTPPNQVRPSTQPDTFFDILSIALLLFGFSQTKLHQCTITILPRIFLRKTVP